MGKVTLNGTFTVQNASSVTIVSTGVGACVPTVAPASFGFFSRSRSLRKLGRECVCMCDSADRFLLPFVFWHDISIVLIEVQSHEDSKLGNEQRRF